MACSCRLGVGGIKCGACGTASSFLVTKVQDRRIASVTRRLAVGLPIALVEPGKITETRIGRDPADGHAEMRGVRQLPLGQCKATTQYVVGEGLSFIGKERTHIARRYPVPRGYPVGRKVRVRQVALDIGPDRAQPRPRAICSLSRSAPIASKTRS